jgi:hypothetical protein
MNEWSSSSPLVTPTLTGDGEGGGRSFERGYLETRWSPVTLTRGGGKKSIEYWILKIELLDRTDHMKAPNLDVILVPY